MVEPVTIPVHLTKRQRDLILNVFAEEYQRIKKSRAKHWQTSTKVMAMTGANEVRNAIVRSEHEAFTERRKASGEDQRVRGDNEK